VALESLRIHGGAGYSTDLPVERYYRDAPLLMIGGGTNELQHLIIARRLLAQHPIQVPEEIL
jgi:alkylation response protein AidB-like acyl-CoA dehydrogenase